MASLDDDGNVKEKDEAVIEVNNDHTSMVSAYGNPFDGAVNIEVDGFFTDNNGNPYWITPTLKYSSVELLEEVEGVVILDPISGNSEYYETGNIPTWVDQVYNPYLR